MKNWYVASTMNDQGLVVDENTGENIAITYKAENATLVASAPEAIRLLAETLDMLNNMTSKEFSLGGDKPIRRKIESFLYDLRHADDDSFITCAGCGESRPDTALTKIDDEIYVCDNECAEAYRDGHGLFNR